MRILKLPLAGLLFCVMALFAGCKTSNEPKAPVALTWEMGASDIEPGYYENTFILKNISQKPLKKNWTIYYSQLPRGVKQEGASEVKVEVVNGNFFKMYPTDEFAPLAPGDSMRITFLCTYKLDRNSHVPEGTYWVETVDGKEGSPLPVALKALPLPSPESMSGYPDATKIYESNLRLAGAPALVQSDILPSVKKAVAIEGDNVVLEGKVALAFPENFAGEAKLLKEKLTGLYGLEVVGNASVKIVLEELLDRKEAVNDEYYTINIDDNLIKISAATPHGIFNGTRTLLSMLKDKQTPYLLEAVSIRDYPDLAYRGQMIDIARNFTAPENLKKLVDIFASYKLNVLHFHFCDDEAWRLEIPGLEELTAVGSRRGHTTDESQCLYPCYDGGYDPDAKTVGNGYYSREEFIDLLKYAAERHVRIVPEIESPGHARAAIVSMKARYNKYFETDPGKATEYMLSEPEDTSRYVSVQYYTDNVMNVALPSTYRFMEKVIQELNAMYQEAGLSLYTVHLGGDEVPRGVWMGSPKCQELMKEKGMTKAHDLSEYFITQMADVMQKNGLKFSGWQEVALGHTEEAHQQLRGQAAGVYCWNTVPGSDEVVYQTANNGYPVILCNVGNFYMDMAYNGHPDERGLDWGGYVDESVSFYIINTQERDLDIIRNQIELHLVQSAYAYHYVTERVGISKDKVMYVSDYIGDIYRIKLPEIQRQNIVLYNPKKGLEVLRPIIEKTSWVKWVPLIGLSEEDMTAYMHISKIYIDFGNHPGKDRIPREAAMCGCCVITNKRGSAAYYEDVPIPDRYKFEAENDIDNIQECIRHICDNFYDAQCDYDEYRRSISREKENFYEDVKKFAEFFV